MDPTKPAHVDSELLLATIARYGCTHMFGSPALLNRLGRDTERLKTTIPSLRVVISGGAPIMPRILAQFRSVLSADAKIHATYGATEALPMASVEAAELLGEGRAATSAGEGTCAGYPVTGLEVKIVPISDAPMPSMTADVAVAPGQVGEIAVRGGIVSPRYHQDLHNDALAKIADAGGTWHRTGDLGKLDESGRIWFAGRKAHRVRARRGALFTVQCEGIFNAHPAVQRTALVGVGPRGAQRPVLCVELAPGAGDARGSLHRVERELREMARSHELTRDIDVFLFHPGFPVDIRHNAKIGREELAAWASRRVPSAAGEGDVVSASPDARLWSRVVPILGWLFLAYGAVWPFANRVLLVLWWIDLALSVGVHALQLVVAVPAGRRAGYSLATTVAYTMLFGATWWKLVEPRELSGRVFAPRESPRSEGV
jgi:acyl-CoA synthetase (AMP-forming)/AMP-acid ligase II